MTRVEVSLNDGKSWILCDVKHPEEPTRYGKYWCWCFWQINVDVLDLLKCKEIVVRAWDAAMNTQPQHLIWNVMVRNPLIFRKVQESWSVIRYISYSVIVNF